MASLTAIEHKIFRAVEHIKALETQLEEYFQTNPGKMLREPDTPDDVAIFRFVSPGPLPTRIGLIVGDCLQNLRSALDYLVWELVLAANRQPGRQNMFPICSTAESFEEALSKRRRLLGVEPEGIALIESLQPYHLGRDYAVSTLWVLDELTNINKHRRILLTNLMANTTDQKPIERDGKLWMAFGPGPTPTYDSDKKFGPFPVVEGEVRMSAQLVAVIAFAEGAAKGMEVSLCLNEWTLYIKAHVVPLFGKFF